MMNSKSDLLTVIILTYNEALHLERCIASARRVADEVLVVDSYSTDGTPELARRLGARVLQNGWKNYSSQFNWALHNGDISTRWVMRLDADEFLDEELAAGLRDVLVAAPSDVGAFEVNRPVRFMGHDIRHGGMFPMWLVRVWRNGWARCESQWMDEHIILLKGRVDRLSGAIIDENLNSLTWWAQKHNGYSSREALDLLDMKHGLGLSETESSGLNRQARLKRYLKRGVYSRLPLGLRPWLYFLYRVVVRRGFLDGRKGMLFHTMQGLWYRLLVDAKIEQVDYVMRSTGCDVYEAIRRVLDIELEPDGTENVEGDVLQ